MFKNINKVIRTIVITDFFYNSAFALFGPVFAIFITSHIHNGTAGVAGLGVSVYWIVKSIFQLPIARFLDKTDGERDDYWAMTAGYFLTGFVPLAYIYVSEPWHLYLVNAIFGLIMAWVVPAWYSIFTRHVDKWRISFEWSLESVFAVGLATAGASALGGWIVDHYGFNYLFIGAAVLTFLCSLLLLTMRKHLFGREEDGRIIPERPHQQK